MSQLIKYKIVFFVLVLILYNSHCLAGIHENRKPVITVFNQLISLHKGNASTEERDIRYVWKDTTDIEKFYAGITGLSTKTEKILKEKGFDKYYLLTSKSIDPDNNEKYDKKAVKNYLKTRFPDKNKRGLLIIDWEKEKFWNLKKPKNSEEFKQAEKEFINIVRYVKKIRPNILVGIYGIPFRVFVDKYPYYAKKGKFLRLLKEFDVISSSLYSAFTDAEKSKAKNRRYLINTIELTLEYANKLKKPVYFFVWEMTSNSKGHKLLPLSQFKRTIKTIKKYGDKNNLVKGIIYYTPSSPNPYRENFKKNTKYLEKLTKKNLESFRNQIVSEYLLKTF